MKKLILAVAFLFAPTNNNALAQDSNWSTYDFGTNSFSTGSIRSGLLIDQGGEGYLTNSYNFGTNSFRTGTITPLGGGKSNLTTYDFGTNSFRSTTITPLLSPSPTLMPSLIAPLEFD